MEEVDKELEGQMQDFDTRTNKLGHDVQPLMEAAKSNFWHVASGILLFVSTMVGTIGILGLAYKARYALESLAWTSLVDKWIRPVFTNDLGQTFYEPVKGPGRVTIRSKWVINFFCICPAATILTAGLSALWAYRSNIGKKKAEVLAEAQAQLKHDVEKHKIMWEGVKMAVLGVKAHYDKVQRLGNERPRHRQEAVKQLAHSLFSMCMAVNELSVWMKDQGCFPPSFSVRNEIGTARHDRIQEVFDEVRPKQQEEASATPTILPSQKGHSKGDPKQDQ